MRLLFLFVLLVSLNCFASRQKKQEEVSRVSEAAQLHITQNATFTMFADGEFKLIKKGSNNFTCFVVREPKGRYEPACLNEEAMRSVFPAYKMHMRLLYSGHTYESTHKKIDDAFNAGILPTAEAGALVYMMSPNNMMYNPANDQLSKTPIHQMYFYPKLNDKTFSLKSGPPWLWQGFPHLSALIVVVDGQ